MTTLQGMRLGMIAAVMGLVLLPMAAAHADDAPLLAVVSATPALMSVATTNDGGFTVTVDQGPRPGAEWSVTATSDAGPPVVLLSSQSPGSTASGRASGTLVLTLVD